MAGIRPTAPGQAATQAATASIASMPQPMGTSARASAPNGISAKAAIAQGMIHSAVSGTATMFAAMPYQAMRLKW